MRFVQTLCLSVLALNTREARRGIWGILVSVEGRVLFVAALYAWLQGSICFFTAYAMFTKVVKETHAVYVIRECAQFQTMNNIRTQYTI